MLFFWPELERQVRIEGTVAKVDPAESGTYFASRPRGARLGAWASPQSEAIEGRAALEARFAATNAQYRDEVIQKGVASFDLFEKWFLGKRSPRSEYRLIRLSTMRPCSSTNVSDQNAFAGGAAAKWIS